MVCSTCHKIIIAPETTSRPLINCRGKVKVPTTMPRGPKGEKCPATALLLAVMLDPSLGCRR
jgi:hypothetical protein